MSRPLSRGDTPPYCGAVPPAVGDSPRRCGPCTARRRRRIADLLRQNGSPRHITEFGHPRFSLSRAKEGDRIDHTAWKR